MLLDCFRSPALRFVTHSGLLTPYFGIHWFSYGVWWSNKMIYRFSCLRASHLMVLFCFHNSKFSEVNKIFLNMLIIKVTHEESDASCERLETPSWMSLICLQHSSPARSWLIKQINSVRMHSAEGWLESFCRLLLSTARCVSFQLLCGNVQTRVVVVTWNVEPSWLTRCKVQSSAVSLIFLVSLCWRLCRNAVKGFVSTAVEAQQVWAVFDPPLSWSIYKADQNKFQFWTEASRQRAHY